MGFGLLFIGYFITYVMSLNSFGFIFRLLGYTVMSLSLLKLRDYEYGFAYPLSCSLALVLLGIYSFIQEGAAKLAIALPEWFSAAGGIAVWAEFILNIALNLTVLYAAALLAARLELQKQRTAAWRNMVLVGIYFVLEFLGMGPLAKNQMYIKYFAQPTLLLQLIWSVLNLSLLFSCYMYICPEGDEDMPAKNAKNNFFDNLKVKSRSKSPEKTEEEKTEHNHNRDK
jgi:hypothetical protein